MSATKRVSHHLIASICQGAFGLITLFFIIPALSNRELGYIAALETLTYLFATVAGLNLDRAASRFYFNRDDVEYRRSLFYTLNVAALGSVVLGALLVFILRGFVLWTFPELSFWPFVVLALARISIEIAGRIEQSHLIASGQSSHFAFGTVFSGAAGVVLSFALVKICKYGVTGYLVAQLVLAFLFSTYLFFSSWRRRGKGKLDLSILSSAMSYAWPFIPTLVVAWVLSYYDRILINKFLGIESLGVYALAIRMASPLLLITGAVSRSIYPTFYSIFRATEGEYAANHRFEFSQSVIYLFGLLALGAMTVGGVLFEILLGLRVEHAIHYFGFIVVIYWVSSVQFISSELLMLVNATKLNMILGLFFASLSLCLNYSLIQYMGLAGAITSGFTTAILAFSTQLYMAQKFMPTRFPSASYLFVLLVLMVTATISLLSSDWRIKLLFLLLGGVLLRRGTLKGVQFFRKHG